jgi:ATP-binding cassette subfamily B protein
VGQVIDTPADDRFSAPPEQPGFHLGLWCRLLAYTRPYWRDLALLATCALTAAAVEVAFPLITRAVIDDVVAHGLQVDFQRYALGYAALTLTLGVATGGFIAMGGKLRTHVSHDIRRDGFENLQRLPFAFYDYRPVGWLMARMTSDCDRLSMILAWGALDLIWGCTIMAGAATIMLVLHAKLALLVLAILPVLGWVSGYFRRRLLQSAREVRRTHSRLTGAYHESIMGLLTTKSFVRERANADDFQTLSQTMYRTSTRNLMQSALYLPVILTLVSLATGLALAVGGIELARGVMSSGTLIAFLTYARHFFEPVEELARWFAEMQMAQAAAERVLSLIDETPAIQDSSAVRAAIAAHRLARHPEAGAIDGGAWRIGSIELDGVSFSYDAATPVLREINLVVRAGETVAIVGPTGGGKSTLIHLICRFYEPTSGAIRLDGIDYRSRSLHWLQSNLGMVLQSPHIFSGTIRDNIRYGRLEASEAEITHAAQLAGAHEFITAMEHGYDTQVGPSGVRLSVGQKQLVSFARAILADPQILVMDEATSSVDTETEQRIQQGLAHVLHGRIAFVIAHRLSTIRHADRIIVLRDGRIDASGTHEELMARRGYYFQMYCQQSLSASTWTAVPWKNHVM